MNNEEIIKIAEITSGHFILPLIKDLVLPKFQKIIKKYSLEDLDIEVIEENFTEYLNQKYEKFLIIDTLTFPNKQTLFKVLYEPLTVTGIDFQKRVEIQIIDYSLDFLPKYARVIIEDTAGMGKSTVTKKIFLSIIEQNAGIPILIELRQINQGNSFLNEIQNQLSTVGNKIPLDVIVKLINEGELIFLFDGFDEISKADRDFVIKDLSRFIEKANNNYFMITSRPEDSLASFGDFQKFRIKPLSEVQAHNLINRYDYYSFKPIAKDLIKQIKKTKENTFKEFITNPFLVSLLYKSFEYKKDIPLKKSQFYRQVFDALFEAHDLTKDSYLKRDKHSNLHLDEFEKVLRYIGYLTSIENKIEYDKNYIINVIDKAKKHLPDLKFQSSDFLKDLLETVPLFKRDGNYIKWAHKSLQDYFSAKFIWIDSKNNQEAILSKIFKEPDNRRFQNVLDLFFELDPKTFENTILVWLLEDYLNYCNNTYKNLPEISQNLINERLAINYIYEVSIVVTKQEHFEKIQKGGSRSIEEYYKQKTTNIASPKQTHYYYFSNPNIAILVNFKYKHNIMTIINIIKFKYPELKKGFTNKSFNVGPQESFNPLPEDTFYEINDSPDNIANNKATFEFINQLIGRDTFLNYDACLKKLKQIQNNKNEALDNDLINW